MSLELSKRMFKSRFLLLVSRDQAGQLGARAEGGMGSGACIFGGVDELG